MSSRKAGYRLATRVCIVLSQDIGGVQAEANVIHSFREAVPADSGLCLNKKHFRTCLRDCLLRMTSVAKDCDEVDFREWLFCCYRGRLTPPAFAVTVHYAKRR